MKNNQCPKDLVSEEDIIKNNWHHDSRNRKPEHKTSKHKFFQETKQEYTEGREIDRRITTRKFFTEN